MTIAFISICLKSKSFLNVFHFSVNGKQMNINGIYQVLEVNGKIKLLQNYLCSDYEKAISDIMARLIKYCRLLNFATKQVTPSIL